MAASPPGSWPDALHDIEKPEPVQPGSKDGDQMSDHRHSHGSKVDEVLPKGKGAAGRIATLPPEIMEQ